MIVINSIEFSKNPVAVNEVFLIRISIVEVIAVWGDLSIKTWSSIQGNTWEEVNLKYF